MFSGGLSRPFVPLQLTGVYATQVVRAERSAVRAHHAGAHKQTADLFPGQAVRAEALECAKVQGDQTLKRYWARTRIEGSAKLFND